MVRNSRPLTPTPPRMTRLQADSLLLLVALIWGSAFVAQSLGMASIGPYAFTGARFLLGALVVLPLAWRERRHAPPLQKRDLGMILGLGGLLFMGAAFQQIGIAATTVTNAGFLTALYVPLVPLLMRPVQRETPHWSIWPASLACLIGTWLLTGAGRVDINVGDLWVIASALFWALHVLYIGRVADRLAAPFTVACGQFVVVGIAGLIAALALEPLSLAPFRAAGGAILYTGLLSVGIAFTGQVVGQRHTPPADAAIILSSETVFAAVFGAWLLDERLSTAAVAGCALILVSVLAVQLLPLFRSKVGQES